MTLKVVARLEQPCLATAGPQPPRRHITASPLLVPKKCRTTNE